jgi:ribosomal protein L13
MGEAMWRKLKVYAGDTHPHQSQQPKVRTIGKRSEVA